MGMPGQLGPGWDRDVLPFHAIGEVEADAGEVGEGGVERATSAAGSGGRRSEAMLVRRWSRLLVPNRTTSMPGSWRA
jgi:hypothetical protein